MSDRLSKTVLNTRAQHALGYIIQIIFVVIRVHLGQTQCP